jgi:putative glutamine amidotransferase
MKPVIGITLDYETKDYYSRYPWYALREDYSAAVEKFGGIPLMLPYALSAIDEYLSIIDGLLVTGGDFDIDPSFYNQTNSGLSLTKGKRTAFEYEILKKALTKKMPILGICAGEQLLNVMLGGSLIQHIPDFIDTDIQHEQDHPKHLPTHKVSVIPSTLLAKITEKSEFMVNSTHHQAVHNLGKGLIQSAVAPDGIIEAIELSDYPFALGVEWHPEYLASQEDEKIMKAYVEACLEQRKTKNS